MDSIDVPNDLFVLLVKGDDIFGKFVIRNKPVESYVLKSGRFEYPFIAPIAPSVFKTYLSETSHDGIHSILISVGKIQIAARFQHP
jgi:hypothetical protein